MKSDLDKLIELQNMVKNLVKSKKRMIQLSEKRSNMCMSTHTERAIDNANATLNWQAMEYDKLLNDVHACAVDCGIADPREKYGYIEYTPSAFQNYRHMPRLPLCRQ
jgi:hypothetical protein